MTSSNQAIPLVDVGPFFDDDQGRLDATDQALAAAAYTTGFVCVRGLPADAALDRAARARLLSIFTLSDAEKRLLSRRKFAPENRNIYRGWFPVQPGNLTAKEGIDLGGDVAHSAGITAPNDPLREQSPLPKEERLPGWHAAVADYYRAMEYVAGALMRSLARSLGLPEGFFDPSFRHGLSTLRLIRYPPRTHAELASVTDPGIWVDHGSPRRYLVGAPHTDSGFVTLLAQDGVAGLQARSLHGDWIDVPPLEGTLVVNFGGVLEQWSAGRIRATEHRVLGSGVERYSIPFFYEARADACIKPLPVDPPDSFAPFEYGDFLWKRICSFVEFRGMESERSGMPETGSSGHSRPA
jgi:isopenicillin N synthase-like dioxygenase